MATSYVVIMGNYKLYPIAVETFGFQFVVYFYASITATFTIWGLLTIKNTDRLSLTEIQDMHKKTEVTGITQSDKEDKNNNNNNNEA